MIENRLDDSGCTMEKLIVENKQILENAINQGLTYVLINNKYEIDVE